MKVSHALILAASMALSVGSFTPAAIAQATLAPVSSQVSAQATAAAVEAARKQTEGPTAEQAQTKPMQAVPQGQSSPVAGASKPAKP
ncbi:hypothetical protein [Novispirillum itersonii]|uniref:hypothetical protein n=1 Tax=Novispirillum itersonii TaxID=189 RepID=UPI000380C611|nr:hypothetical protein [Novispirillum itersonii]